MSDDRFILVNAAIAPQIMVSVLEAKRLLATGEAKSISEAIKMTGISRSVYYKYKDYVFDYGQRPSDKLVTLLVTLKDEPGVLSQVIAQLYRAGANIVTMNQSNPIGKTALVNISVRTDNLTTDVDTMIKSVETLAGVKSIISIDSSL